MFSGIVEGCGRVSAGSNLAAGVLEVQSELFSADAAVGDSIAINGVCLTVVRAEGDRVCFDISSETQRCTTLGGLSSGSEVNVERALRYSDRIQGHFVLGHVDGVTDVVDIRCEANNTMRLALRVPQEWAPYVAPKGSIAVEGVSLTVGEVQDGTCALYIIPFTWDVTNFHNLQVGSKVNIELDSLARYVVQALRAREL